MIEYLKFKNFKKKNLEYGINIENYVSLIFM